MLQLIIATAKAGSKRLPDLTRSHLVSNYVNLGYLKPIHLYKRKQLILQIGRTTELGILIVGFHPVLGSLYSQSKSVWQQTLTMADPSPRTGEGSRTNCQNDLGSLYSYFNWIKHN